MSPSTSLHRVTFVLLVMLSFDTLNANAQTPLPDRLLNGGMEDVDGETPAGWRFNSTSGATLSIDSEEPFEGSRAALLDAANPAPNAERLFTNIMQLVDGRPWQSKTVRFKAAVRTADLAADATAQLWFRVDRSGTGPARMGAFDNMQDRPIRQGEWSTYEIVLPVADDAKQLAIGMFVLGSGKAWIDDATLEIVNDETPTTEMDVAVGSTDDDDEKKKTSSRFQRPPIIMKALSEAEDAPQQPVLTPWLWLVALGVTLFALSAVPPTELTIADGKTESRLGFLPKFAVRFSVVYWLLYAFPSPFSNLLPYIGTKLSVWYSLGVNAVVPWTALNVFGLEGELVPPNGSGDTTFAYIQAFIGLVVALALAVIWSLVDRRQTDYRTIKDLLRSHLRYVLALIMLSYGLAKVAWDMNQFPAPSDAQLNKTWGDSSPMNVAWTFMGASRAYTVFGGMGELVGAVLLLWRRTANIGALVVFGVMLNVLMINMCYDVPVKLYSFHLICMAVCIVLPDAGRLANVFLFHRAAHAVSLRPVYVRGGAIWVHRAIKTAILIVGFGIPIYQHLGRQIDYFAEQQELPEYFGRFEVTEFQLDGRVVEADAGGWRSVTFQRLPYNNKGEMKPTDWMSVGLLAGGNVAVNFTETADSELTLSEHESPLVPAKTIAVDVEDDQVTLTGKLAAGELKVRLKPADSNRHRLTRRGFRWINEVPFNR